MEEAIEEEMNDDRDVEELMLNEEEDDEAATEEEEGTEEDELFDGQRIVVSKLSEGTPTTGFPAESAAPSEPCQRKGPHGTSAGI